MSLPDRGAPGRSAPRVPTERIDLSAIGQLATDSGRLDAEALAERLASAAAI